ncbi:MAG: tripartite tricarboxylate transporter substrate-binding protein [Burkholderiales bacterium]
MAGTGGTIHVTSELFNMMAGVKTNHIPYKGNAPAIIDLMAGQVHLHFTAPIAVVSQIKGGKLKAISISGEKRAVALPQVPTFAEAGLPGFEARSWYGWLAPIGTPRTIIERLSVEVARILALSDTREKLQSQAMETFISTPEQMAKLIAADRARFAKIIRVANIKIEN